MQRPWRWLGLTIMGAALLALAGCAPLYVERPGTGEPAIRVAVAHHADSFVIGGTKPVLVSDRIHASTLPAGERWAVTADSAELRASTSRGTRISGIDGWLRFPAPFADGGARFIELRTDRDSGLAIIQELPLERYVTLVVSKEIGNVPGNRIEAAKAQAVASRSYAYARMRAHSPSGYDVESDVSHQAYQADRPVNDEVARAVRRTRGLVIAYGGRPVMANYSSCCGGRTALPSEAWAAADSGFPFLASVADPFCEISPRSAWADTLNADSVRMRLFGPADSASCLNDISVIQRGPSGRVMALKVSSDRGDTVLYRNQMRSQLAAPPLPSNWFDIAPQRDSLGHILSIILNGHGFGHGVGLCQWGALGMADRGWSYKKILAHYYHNIELLRLFP
jgi:stage II sporulation protein D